MIKLLSVIGLTYFAYFLGYSMHDSTFADWIKSPTYIFVVLGYIGAVALVMNKDHI